MFHLREPKGKGPSKIVSPLVELDGGNPLCLWESFMPVEILYTYRNL
jgi:hypothetical protein